MKTKTNKFNKIKRIQKDEKMKQKSILPLQLKKKKSERHH